LIKISGRLKKIKIQPILSVWRGSVAWGVAPRIVCRIQRKKALSPRPLNQKKKFSVFEKFVKTA